MSPSREPSLKPSIKDELTALDWIAVLVVSACVLILVLMYPLVWARTFAGMYREFGGPLPRATVLVLKGWPTALWGLLPAGLVGAALVGARPLRTRRALIVAAFVAGMLGIAAAWWALYLPLWQLADAIR